MAYAATVTTVSGYVDFAGRSRKLYRVLIAEVEATTSSEYSVSGLPTYCTCVGVKSDLLGTGGDEGTTVQPRFGNATGWTTTTIAHQFQVSAAAAFVNVQTSVRLYLPSQKLFGVTTTNSGTDSDAQTELYIVEGWWE